MFKSISALGDEDLELDTAFAPIFSSTQSHSEKRSNEISIEGTKNNKDTLFNPTFSNTQSHSKKQSNELPIEENSQKMDTALYCRNTQSHSEKRQVEVPTEEISKKIKLDSRLELQKSPFIRNDSFENSKDSSFYSPNKVVKRIFPGPAGLLGDNFTSFKQNSELVSKNYNSDKDFIFCSQRTLSTFAEGPWKLMEEDFHRSNGDQLFEKYTISWIQKNYSHKKVLDNYKAPFLAAVIESLDKLHGKIPSVHLTLKDTTGIIDATVLYSFYNEYAEYLTTGSVIVLKQFGVLTSPEGHCLTITANNLLVIYHVKDPNCKENPEKDHIQKIVLQHSSTEDIWRDANNSNVTGNKPQFCKLLSSEKVIPKTFNSSISGVFKESASNTSNFILPKSKVTVKNTHNTNILQQTEFQSDINNKFKFKMPINSRQTQNELSNIRNKELLPQSNEKDNNILKTMLEDIDTDALFDDF